MQVGIIDYGMGNLASVCSALAQVGAKPVILSSPSDLEHYTHAILPGVGSFAKAMQNLRMSGWDDAIKTRLFDDKFRLLGICLGMHLLSDMGNEHGVEQGLGLIPGEVIHFEAFDKFPKSDFPVPHVGWNELHMQQPDHVLFNGVNDKVDVYFVHSYFFKAKNQADILANTPYGFEFPSIVGNGKVIGAQFHPEKSGTVGFALLKNFMAL